MLNVVTGIDTAKCCKQNIWIGLLFYVILAERRGWLNSLYVLCL
jgi:hypothetical protein